MRVILGKVVGHRFSLYAYPLPQLDTETLAFIAAAELLAQVDRRTRFNLVRLDDQDPHVSRLIPCLILESSPRP